MILRSNLLAGLTILFFATNLLADFNLQVTEVWPGNEPGSNLTSDWFEITNLGDMAWVAANDGDLWFDDDSADASTADLMMGISAINPGESVIFVDGDDGDVTEFLSVWDPVKSQGQVGFYQGAGLSQGGDAVSIWISAGAPMGTPDLFAAYPDAELNGGQSFDFLLNAFSVDGNAAGAVTTIAVNSEGQPGVGSPGMVVPEPASTILLAVCMAGPMRRRR